MKITVLNGSPKGDLSVTMFYIKYLAKIYPEHDFEILNITQNIKKIENDESYFNGIIEKVNNSKLIVWGFPLYVCTAHADYHRFIELIFEKNAEHVFNNKFAAAITTSIHFFDHTAHNFIRAISDDLKVKFVDSYSASMRDLLDKNERKIFTQFAENLFYSIENNVFKQDIHSNTTDKKIKYAPAEQNTIFNPEDKKIIVLTDSVDHKSNLSNMVKQFTNNVKGNVQVYNLHDIDIKGGCQGCISCGYDYTCIYTGKDGYIDFVKNKVMPVDIIIMAGTIKNRYLSSRWKTFFDRMFFNTHTPTLKSKQLGFIISGNLSENENIKQALTGITEWQEANLNGFVTDETDKSENIDNSIHNLASTCITNAKTGYIKPKTFLGVAGLKIFRDEIYSEIKFPFRADHKYYKKHGVYDLPKKNYFISFLLGLLRIFPGLRKKIYSPKFMKHGMIRNFKKLMEKM